MWYIPLSLFLRACLGIYITQEIYTITQAFCQHREPSPVFAVFVPCVRSEHELGTKEHKQRLIDCFVNAVYLYDDKLVITFNYKEASKTVTLKEVNGSIIECSGAPKRKTR